MKKIQRYIKLYLERKKWRKRNKHNYTYIKNLFCSQNVKVGIGTYGGICLLNDIQNVVLKIGSYCSIAEEVVFILGADHPTKYISTFPFKYKFFDQMYLEAISKGDIIVDDDVWIGYGATIMSGVHIGQGAVVAAGAVVTKDVPPYAIVGGVPAKVIKYRFEPEMIKELLKIDYSKLTKEDIEKHIDGLYVELKNKSQLDWMPKKTISE